MALGLWMGMQWWDGVVVGMLMVRQWVTTPSVFLVAPAHPLMYVCARMSDSNRIPHPWIGSSRA